MEDEKGLDLSLGLPCGGNSSSQKSKQISSSEVKSDEGDRGSKLINEFKNFLEGGNQQHPLQVGEDFNYTFHKPAADVETSKNLNVEGSWLPSDARSIEIDDKGEKRKNMFVESRQQKKRTRETSQPDLTDKPKVSHISITTDEGSTAENEDVADSEVDGSTSRHASQPDDVSKRFVSTSNGASRVQKEFNVTNMSMNMSYLQSQLVKDSITSGTPSLSKFPMSPNMMHVIAATHAERSSGVQPVVPANFPMMYGYTPMQLPVLERDSTRGVPQHQQINHIYSERNQANPNTQNDGRKHPQVISPKSSETTQFDVRVAELGKAHGKQQVGQEGSSSPADGDLQGHHAMHQGRDEGRDVPDGEELLPSEFPAIKRGLSADLKFGGCGSCPNLPWVFTVGSGPHGRTISGVTYKFNSTQIKIVCACHGTHMSPEEFIRHASDESSRQGGGTGFTSLPGGNRAASAKS